MLPIEIRWINPTYNFGWIRTHTATNIFYHFFWIMNKYAWTSGKQLKHLNIFFFGHFISVFWIIKADIVWRIRNN